MSSSKLNPSVTIGIPAFNEEKYIETVISGFLNSSYANIKEIVIADGGSKDNTREIVEKYSKADSRVKLIDNPKKYQSFGLNLIIDMAQGDVFIRADAHCEYGNDYIEKCIENLKRDKVKNSGGAARFLAKNWVQAGTSLAVQSYLGHGGAKHYDPNYEGYSDTVPMGCFWIKDLRELGGFSEKNLTNQDAEINYRIRTKLNGRIYISPDIKLRYYPRDKIFQLFKQYFRYGRGRCITSNFHSGDIPLRSKAPFVFVCLVIMLLVADYFLFEGYLKSPFYLLFFAFFILVESFRTVLIHQEYLKEEIWKNSEIKHPGVIKTSFSVFLVLVVMHLAHFLGYGYQLIKSKVFRVDGW